MAASLTFSLASGLVAWILYSNIRWTLDSPVLRRAWRNRRFGLGTHLGMVLVAGLTVWALYTLGVRQPSVAAAFFAGMFFLFGAAAVLFCGLLIEDVREVFLTLARKMYVGVSFDSWGKAAGEPAESASSCKLPSRRCTEEAHHHCGSAAPSSPWRPTDWQRSHQHH